MVVLVFYICDEVEEESIFKPRLEFGWLTLMR
jgi:hypothetical protein